MPWIAGNASLYPQKVTVQRLKTAEKEITGLHSAQAARSCCLPTERRRSNSGGSLRVVSGLAENTNSIFCDGPSGPETVNGCPVLRRQEPLPRGTRCELRVLNMLVLARSSVARVRRTVFSLDNDLHGCRQTVEVDHQSEFGARVTRRIRYR